MTIVSTEVGEVPSYGKELEKDSWKNIWAGISKDACDFSWSLGTIVVCCPPVRSSHPHKPKFRVRTVPGTSVRQCTFIWAAIWECVGIVLELYFERSLGAMSGEPWMPLFEISNRDPWKTFYMGEGRDGDGVRII